MYVCFYKKKIERKRLEIAKPVVKFCDATFRPYYATPDINVIKMKIIQMVHLKF